MSEKKTLRGRKIVPTDPSKKPEIGPEEQLIIDNVNKASRIARGIDPVTPEYLANLR